MIQAIESIEMFQNPFYHFRNVQYFTSHGLHSSRDIEPIPVEQTLLFKHVSA